MSHVVIAWDALWQGPQPFVDRLRQAGFEVRFPKQRLTDEAGTIAELTTAAAAIAGGEPYTDRVFSSLPGLRVVARAGVGFDRVDLDAATRRRVVVTITPAANFEAVAEHTLAFMLALARSVPQRNVEVRQGTWNRSPFVPLRGRTLGIAGLGRIGRAVAERAAAFRMKLLAFEPYPDRKFVQSLGIELMDLDTLLSRSDFVTLHLPLSSQTQGIINRSSLSRMKPGSYLINTARGGLVVERDLLDALQSGHLAGAGLDVFEQEPTPADNPLLKHANVIVSPHMGGGDVQSIQDMGNDAAQCIIDLHNGKWPEAAVVNPAVRPGWSW